MSAFDQFLDRLAACFTPQMAERIEALQLDPDLLARITYLARKANEGRLTAKEDFEYKEYIEAGDMFAQLKARARRFLRQHGK
jgi:hypothetical protein